MDSCFIDVTVEFLSIAFHNILYYASVYPASVFDTRKKYGVVVYRSTHPEINEYIELCLKSIAQGLSSSRLTRIEFSVTDGAYAPVLKFVFDVSRNESYDETIDAYLVQTEQNLRAFCLNLSSLSSKFTLPEDCSFTIRLHTDESTAVAMSANPDLEGFPMVEADVEDNEEMNKIIPLRRFSIRSFILDTYVEVT